MSSAAAATDSPSYIDHLTRDLVACGVGETAALTLSLSAIRRAAGGRNYTGREVGRENQRAAREQMEAFMRRKLALTEAEQRRIEHAEAKQRGLSPEVAKALGERLEHRLTLAEGLLLTMQKARPSQRDRVMTAVEALLLQEVDGDDPAELLQDEVNAARFLLEAVALKPRRDVRPETKAVPPVNVTPPGEFYKKGHGSKKDGGPRPHLLDLQERLNALGFKVAVDGWMGTQTEAAIKHFQKEHGLDVTGELDATTVRTLRAAQPLVEPRTFPVGSNQKDDPTKGEPEVKDEPAKLESKADEKEPTTIKEVSYSEALHPRNRLGRWIGKLSPGSSSSFHGVKVERLQDREGEQRFRVTDHRGRVDDNLYGVGNAASSVHSSIHSKLHAEERARESESGNPDFNAAKERARKRAKKLVEASWVGVPTGSPGQPSTQTRKPYGGITPFLGAVDVPPPDPPPNLRAATDADDCCRTCVHFSGKGGCELYDYPVREEDTCDSQRSVMDALGVESELQEAVRARKAAVGDSAGFARALARERVLRLRIAEAADSMAKATVHEPVGKPGGPGLWHHKGLQLPAYIQHIANDIREKRGKTTSSAIAIAIGAVKKWCRGGGNVDSGTKAAACKAVAEWEALKATHRGSARDIPGKIAGKARDIVQAETDDPFAEIEAIEVSDEDIDAVREAAMPPVKGRGGAAVTVGPGGATGSKYQEAKHPRQAKGRVGGGKFASKGGGPKRPVPSGREVYGTPQHRTKFQTDQIHTKNHVQQHGLIWGGQVFHNRASFKTWLGQHGVTYEHFQARHGGAATGLEAHESTLGGKKGPERVWGKAYRDWAARYPQAAANARKKEASLKATAPRAPRPSGTPRPSGEPTQKPLGQEVKATPRLSSSTPRPSTSKATSAPTQKPLGSSAPPGMRGPVGAKPKKPKQWTPPGMRGPVGIRQAEVEEAAITDRLGRLFRPELHPRTRLGQFADVLSSLKHGESARLPSGVRVQRTHNGYHVAPRKPTKSTYDAARSALGMHDAMVASIARTRGAHHPAATAAMKSRARAAGQTGGAPDKLPNAPDWFRQEMTRTGELDVLGTGRHRPDMPGVPSAGKPTPGTLLPEATRTRMADFSAARERIARLEAQRQRALRARERPNAMALTRAIVRERRNLAAMAGTRADITAPRTPEEARIHPGSRMPGRAPWARKGPLAAGDEDRRLLQPPLSDEHDSLVTRLSDELQALDKRQTKKEPTPNIYRLGHYLGAVDTFEDKLRAGHPPERAYSESFTPTRETHGIAKKLGIAVDVEHGRWKTNEPPTVLPGQLGINAPGDSALLDKLKSDVARARAPRRTTARDYLGEKVEYGGQMVTRGEMQADLERIARLAHPNDPAEQRAVVERYMQGHAQRERVLGQRAAARERVTGLSAEPDYSGMSVSELAGHIQRDWGSQGKGVNFAAKPYLEAMHSLSSANDTYGMDSGKSIIAYFLSNASSYRGPKAKAIKAELKKHMKMSAGRPGQRTGHDLLTEAVERRKAAAASGNTGEFTVALAVERYLRAQEAVLTAKARKQISPGDFVYPKEKRYPIHDRAHAANALARSSGKPEESTVRSKVCARYPDLPACGNKSDKGE